MRVWLVAIALMILVVTPTVFAQESDPEPRPEQRILFFSDQHDPNWRLYSMKSDGTDVQHVATHPDDVLAGFDYFGADLSPNGRTLSYVRQICPGSDDICDRVINLIDMITGEIQPLTEGTYDWNPIWSPDGQFIAFYNRMEFPFAAVVEVNTSEIVLNIGARLLRTVGDGSAGVITGMSWAPDSERLVISVSNPPDGDESLYLVTLAGEIERISESLRGYDPAWQADSEVIYYGCYVENRLPVCRVDLTTREWELVPGLLPQIEALDFDYRFASNFSVNKEDELLFNLNYRIPGTEQVIYHLYKYDTSTNTLTNLSQNMDYNMYRPRWHTVPSAGMPPVADAGADQTFTTGVGGFASFDSE